MSDAKSGAREFVGEGREEAIHKACAFFGVDDASALDISGYAAGTIYGLARRTVIVAAPKGSSKAAPGRARDDEGRGDDGWRGSSGRGGGRDSGRGRDRGRGGRGRESSADSRESREPRGNRGSTANRHDDRSDRSDRAEREERSDRPERSARGERSEREDRPDRSERAERPGQSDRPERAAAASGGPSARSVVGELGEIGEFLAGTIERMELGSFEISESRDGEMIVLQVKGAAADALSSGHGRTVDALQLLANQVSARISPDRQRVVIDVEGDDDAREEFLARLAERVAKRALQTGRAVALDPMNSRDRRLIHVALRDREDVATMSEGEGRYRQVVVVPESSEEFEDARAKSKRAGYNS